LSFTGDGTFVESVLERQNENFERRYRLQSQGYGFDEVIDRVCEVVGLRREEILGPSKEPERVLARSPLLIF
jgi:hypothetical protein